MRFLPRGWCSSITRWTEYPATTGAFIRAEAQRPNIFDQVHYVHGLHLPSLLRAARRIVALNSTVGCSSLHHGTPVKVLRRGISEMDGLTYQRGLAAFWQDPGRVDRKLFRKYRAGPIELSQINGCFLQSRHWPRGGVARQITIDVKVLRSASCRVPAPVAIVWNMIPGGTPAAAQPLS